MFKVQIAAIIFFIGFQIEASQDKAIPMNGVLGADIAHFSQLGLDKGTSARRDCLNSLKKISLRQKMGLQSGYSMSLRYNSKLKKQEVVLTRVEKDRVIVVTPEGSSIIGGRSCHTSKKPTSDQLLAEAIGQIKKEEMDIQSIKIDGVSAQGVLKAVENRRKSEQKDLLQKCSTANIALVSEASREALKRLYGEDDLIQATTIKPIK